MKEDIGKIDWWVVAQCGAVVVLLFEVFATLAHISRAVGTWGAKGSIALPPDLADQLTLYQSSGSDYAHDIITCPPPPDFQTFLRP